MYDFLQVIVKIFFSVIEIHVFEQLIPEERLKMRKQTTKISEKNNGQEKREI